MWADFIEANQHRDLTWLVEGLQKGTIVWVCRWILPQKQGTQHQWRRVDVLQHRSNGVDGRYTKSRHERKILGKI